MYRWRWLCLVLGLLLGLPLFAIGEPSGALVGFVYDEAGKDLAGVEIKITSPSLPDGSRETISAEDGSFAFDGLPPGTYELTATKPDYKTIKRSNLAVVLNKSTFQYFDMKSAAAPPTDASPVFTPHEKLSKEAREEINYCSNLKPQTPVFWQEPGSILNHQGAVTKPPLKTVDDILAVELMQKTFAPSTRRLKKLAGENSEVFPSDQTLQRMRLEAASRQENLLAVAFIQYGFHPYSVFSFIAFNDEVYVIETYLRWNKIFEKSVTRISAEQLETFLTETTGVLDCAVTCNEPRLSGGSSLVSWNSSGVPTQCKGGLLDAQANHFSDLLDKVTENETTSYQSSHRWEQFTYRWR